MIRMSNNTQWLEWTMNGIDYNNNAQWQQWTMKNEQWTMTTMTMKNHNNDNEKWQQCTTIYTRKHLL